MQLDDTIDSLLGEQDEQKLFAKILERKRKLAHTRARLSQPLVGVELGEEEWRKIRAFARQALSKDEQGQGGLDHLTVTVMDCLEAGSADDLLFALLRVWRKCHALQPHLGSIEAE